LFSAERYVLIRIPAKSIHEANIPRWSGWPQVRKRKSYAML